MTDRNAINEWYTRHFTAPGAAERDRRKHDNPLERIRHRHEVELLKKFVTGSVFDCSIATARLVGELPCVRSFAGMDYSEEFLSYVRRLHPDVPVVKGDLRDGIPQSDNRYDTTVCLRTLSALGHVRHIVGEMARVTRPGGLVIFDYGTRSQEYKPAGGEIVVLDAEDPKAAIRAAGMEGTMCLPLDGLIVLTKRSPRLFRILSRLSAGPSINRAIGFIERLSVGLRNERYLYIARVPE